MMVNNREGVYDAIDTERDYQNLKWGERRHSVAEWIMIMRGELQEAEFAWQKECSDQRALEELLQAVAVGVACLEEHGVFHEQKHLDLLQAMLRGRIDSTEKPA